MIPRSWRLHDPPQSLIRLRGSVEAGQKLRIGFGAHREHGAIEQGVFRRLPRRVEDEVGSILAPRLGGAVDQVAFLRLDADIERVAFGNCCGHCGFLRFKLTIAPP